MTFVLAYDGSDCARDAIRTAGRLFRGGDAVVLHVVVSLAPEVFHGRVEELAEVVEAQRIAGDGAALAQEAGFVARPAVEVTPGHAGDAIVAYAEQVGADAIVVGARGLSTVKSLLLGSVSHGVVQHAHVPVLVVHTRGQ